jgi:hypothetical protein
VTVGFRTIDELREDIKYRFNAQGQTVRHPPARIAQLINVSQAEARSIYALTSDGAYLEPTDPTPLPLTAAATGETYAEVDWPVNAVAVFGVRVKTAERWRWLKRTSFAAIGDYQCARGRRPPIAYHSRKVPTGGPDGPNEEVPGKVMLAPVPISGVYRLWYLQAWVPLLGNDDKLGPDFEMLEWIVWNTCIKMMGADQQKTKFYELCATERKLIQDRVEARAMALDSGLATEPRDARGDGYDDDRYGEDW